MKKLLFIVFAVMLCVSFAHCEEGIEVIQDVISLGKRGKPKHARYEIGSIGGVRKVHDRVYERGGTLKYGRRSTENITGFWGKVKVVPFILNAQIAYVHSSYRYDRFVGPGDFTRGKFHGHSIGTAIETQYNPFEMKKFKITPLLGLRYRHLHKNAYTEEGSPNSRSYEKNSLRTTQLEMGAILERDLEIFSRKCWIYSKLMYLYTLHDSSPEIRYTINNGPVQVERSNFQKRHGFEMELGTAINIFHKWDMDICYQLFANGKLSSHGALWRVSYNF